MRALSVRQPWAWLLCAGRKQTEYRSWRMPPCAAGKWLALHASAAPDAAPFDLVPDMPDVFPLGAIVGLIRFGPSVLSIQSGWDWPVLDVIALHDPIKCRGALNLWRVPEEIAQGLSKKVCH